MEVASAHLQTRQPEARAVAEGSCDLIACLVVTTSVEKKLRLERYREG